MGAHPLGKPGGIYIVERKRARNGGKEEGTEGSNTRKM